MYIGKAAPSIHKLYEELDRLLEIPDNVVLPGDEEKVISASDEDLESLKRDVATAEKRVKRAALMEALLKVEMEELKSIEKHCDLARQTMDALESSQKVLLNKTETSTKLLRDTKQMCEGGPLLKNNFL